MQYARGVICLSIVFLVVWAKAQSPHGTGFAINCASCHTADSWKVSPTGIAFNHDSTAFPLSGQHLNVDCRQCHTALEFSKAETNCSSCHLDVHQQSVGLDCNRCHDTNSWLINNIAELHREVSFPLLGAHATTECISCHQSETALRFEPMSTECITCHESDFRSTTNPDHTKAGFSVNCIECHRYDAFDWGTDAFNHDFFPLTQGHDINDCARCHTGADYSKVSPECITCHETDYLGTQNPNHQAIGISTSCIDCHTTAPGWNPAEYRQHDELYFPVYSGSHRGAWTECKDCHTDQNNFSSFTCITCHQESPTGEEHHGVTGYVYNSTACLACHPTGEADGAFDHNNTGFALTGSHTTVNCLECHSAGFEGTPSDCFACHTEDFNLSANPNHIQLGLPTDCASCHTTDPDWNPAKFDMHNDFYPLNGAHAMISNQCATCHNGDYNNTPNTCFGCHQQDYNQADNPSHTGLQFSTECATCHSETAWVPASNFDHNEIYVLEGAHAAIATECAACHGNGFDNTPNTCFGCHSADYDATTEPPHNQSGFNTDCAACHNQNSWQPANFDHDAQYFPIYSGKHSGVWSQCTDCHTNPNNYSQVSCIVCHTNPETDDAHQSVNGYLYSDALCLACHPTGDADMAFDHNQTGFPLTGAHTMVNCLECHTSGFENTPTDCYACHMADFNHSINPGHPSLGLPTDCASCHTTDPGWAPASFDIHNNYYALNGAHAAIATQCVTCHNGDYNNTPNTCSGCHQPDYNQATNPPHATLQFPTDCATCHGETAWVPGSFPIHDNYYPLQGAHAVIANDCAACHNGDYVNTPSTCFGCHAEDYTNTTDPSHVVTGFNNECATCHNENAWAPANFDHDAQYFPIYSGDHNGVWSQCTDCHTNPNNFGEVSCIVCHTNPETDDQHMGVNGYQYNNGLCQACHPTGNADMAFDHNLTNFPLTGAHIAVNCLECHVSGFEGTPTECNACHQNDFNGATNPNHNNLGLPTDCASCHTTDPGWAPASFDIHNNYYALNGAHAAIANQCVTCHNGDYNNTPNTCAGCHQPDYNQADNPSHTNLAFPVECATCHSESAWVPADFPIHDNYYPIQGAHTAIANDCAACHNGDYTNTPNTCFGCHAEDYNNTTDPSHVVAGFGNDCATCHSENAWAPANFDHDAQYFPIYSGAHNGVWSQCTDCHTNPNNFGEVSCIVCHINPETDQDHTGVNGYAYADALCLACHPTGSADMAFNHNQTNFPLTGAHTTVNCLDCHAGGFEGTPTACDACHLPDYNQSTNPNHINLAIPTDCAACHTTDPDWMPATFAIHNNYYPLNGAHAAIANQCVTCHNGDYNNTPNTCAGCHQDDYNGTTNPPHSTLGFPTDCASCHTESAWVPAEYSDHDDLYFPIYSGDHQGVWDQCNDCHTNPNNYAIYSCVICHTNPETNQDHSGVSGYVYENAACLACHPTGDAQNAFDHNQSNFPLTGAHIGVNCAECHSGGYQGTPTDCEACHMPDYNQSTNPNHTSLSIPTDCASCHTTDPDWNPALFPIHNNYYPLQGAHAAIANQCATCHNGDYNNTPNTCVGCHLTDYNQTNDPDHEAANFPTTCETCHSQNSWVPATWDHDDMYFPIYSGKHDDEWNQCSDCHNDPNNYAVFTCLTCHLPGPTNNDHDEVSGYQYNSAACYACHPDGED